MIRDKITYILGLVARGWGKGVGQGYGARRGHVRSWAGSCQELGWGLFLVRASFRGFRVDPLRLHRDIDWGATPQGLHAWT